MYVCVSTPSGRLLTTTPPRCVESSSSSSNERTNEPIYLTLSNNNRHRPQRPFTALVNTIESVATGPLETQDLAALKQAFDVNAFGALAVVQKFLPLIRQQGSRIVLMSSLCARLTPPLFGGLCASKAALECAFALRCVEPLVRAWFDDE